MKIVADQNMPLVTELFGAYGTITQLPGRQITADDVRDADVLLVRSTTRVDQSLLADSAVAFVGSATIGVDHIDTAWLADRGIAFANAPGCNARAVVEYDLAALAAVAPDWRERRVGVVGCGNVGSRVLAQLKALGVACVGYDPLLPSGSSDLAAELVSFSSVLECDVLCLHTPLTREGPFPSWHLFDEAVLEGLAPGTVLLNAGRGAVVDNGALLQRLEERGDLRVVLDVWEGEPEIDRALMQRVDVATPHIAGYSLAGRERGTEMVLAAFLAWQQGQQSLQKAPQAWEKVPQAWQEAPQAWQEAPQKNRPVVREPLCLGEIATLNEAILAAYPILADHRAMVAALASLETTATAFDGLRRDYPQRREFSEYRYRADGLAPPLAASLQALGFLPAQVAT